jgi:ribosome-binding ATPase YchF (GTP1/OBG family)
VDAKIEDELKDFEGDELSLMREELGAHDSGVDGLIKAGFDLLGLESYLTTGEMETRAWTIKKGSPAPVAAAAIHTDFEKKFIKAEVVSYEDLVRTGSFAEAKNQGVLRTEGKEYVVKDGDVVEFKIGG